MLTLIFSTIGFCLVVCILFALLFIILTFLFGKEMEEEQNCYIIPRGLFELYDVQKN